MRELKLVKDGGASEGFVLTPVDGDGTELFHLPLDADIRAIIANSPLDDAEGDAHEDATQPTAADSPSVTDGDSAAAPSEPASDDASAGDAGEGSVTKPVSAPESAPKPKIVLRPREIQDRIRGGATVEDLVEYSGMAAKKIEPFAHPVIAERMRIAELGKQSRPRRSDGPAKLTLWEILATAFAARGQELADASWDARRDPTGQWIVSVAWQMGHTDNVAEWSYQADGAHALTVARNDLAAELVDPDFSRRNSQRNSQADFGGSASAAGSVDSAGSGGEPGVAIPQRLPNTWIRPVDDSDVASSSQVASAGAGSAADDAEGEGFEDFMLHPDEEEHPKRRRKTVMPSWEDVLLGVRPKDPKK